MKMFRNPQKKVTEENSNHFQMQVNSNPVMKEDIGV